MKLEHKFTVAATLDTVWLALLDPERVAPCMPGATITSVNGDEFAGIVKIRLGPISLQYRGSGRFTETDEAAHRTVIQANGTAAGGQGTVAATVQASLAENGQGTAVTVVTDLTGPGRCSQLRCGRCLRRCPRRSTCSTRPAGRSPDEPYQRSRDWCC